MEDTQKNLVWILMTSLIFVTMLIFLSGMVRVSKYDASTAPYADVVITSVSEQGDTVILTGKASGDVNKYLVKGATINHLQMVQRTDDTVKLLLVKADDVSYNKENGVVYWCNYETTTSGVAVGAVTSLTKNVGVGVAPVTGTSKTHVSSSGTFVVGDTIHYYTDPMFNTVTYTMHETAPENQVTHSMSDAVALD